MVINPKIYCLMITGMQPVREKFAKIAIENFKQQSYLNKELIIINHGDFTLGNDINITEHKVKPAFIGKLRNQSLDCVPEGELWTIWDDDDWRHQDYLSLLSTSIIHDGYLGSCLTKQLQYSFPLNSAWVQVYYRFAGTLMYIKDDTRYNEKWLWPGEDTIFLRSLDHKKIFKIPNLAYVFLRFIHHDNNCFNRGGEDHFSLSTRVANEYRIDMAGFTYLTHILKAHYHEFLALGQEETPTT